MLKTTGLILKSLSYLLLSFVRICPAVSNVFQTHNSPENNSTIHKTVISKESVDFITYLFAVRTNLKLTLIKYELETMEKNTNVFFYDIALYTSHAMDQTV